MNKIIKLMKNSKSPQTKMANGFQWKSYKKSKCIRSFPNFAKGTKKHWILQCFQWNYVFVVVIGSTTVNVYKKLVCLSYKVGWNRGQFAANLWHNFRVQLRLCIYVCLYVCFTCIHVRQIVFLYHKLCSFFSSNPLIRYI